ncbi:acetyl-CoA carboxylase biotin carboxyl carrier protein subunit [Nocardioides psychrotolerans]|uniref:Acyl-CoA carboxylase epsilon subunit n=1 Tax=Nocardioides psychrotolerans TaxID=1005945 RepID=A0A1I3BCQ6_9ACTN|nr:acyl-CoA carboxylase subunit epsilon [Nocardioides psychrotolerans]GEP36742.1 acetyl-CoA carboxylase biotin carboxyl carrier protein subunit [Nocardioides psychrotolerans]SFH59501.1 Acyl-CoA carboxylase epsilon subunit [Nocardioides psychrotolerans]
MAEHNEAAAAPDTRPLLRVVGSDATPEEIAALVAVFAALGSGDVPAPRHAPQWQSPHRKVRQTLPHGPGGWRASGLPR